MVKYPARRSAVAAAVKEARDYRGISQRKLSERLDEAPTYMHMIESGQQALPVEEFIAICLQLDLDPCEILKSVMQASPPAPRRRKKKTG
jgi:transcriptional regulator with XRE-family HTH domain